MWFRWELCRTFKPLTLPLAYLGNQFSDFPNPFAMHIYNLHALKRIFSIKVYIFIPITTNIFSNLEHNERGGKNLMFDLKGQRFLTKSHYFCWWIPSGTLRFRYIYFALKWFLNLSIYVFLTTFFQDFT